MEKASDQEAEMIFSKVLEDIKPSPSEIKETTRRVNNLMMLLKQIVPNDVELRVAGSIARGTNLRGDADVDIFMLFNKKMKRDRIVKLGLEYGKGVIKKEKGRFEVKYAEHPYIRLYLDSVGMKADIVPALKIDNIEEMGTTVDRTPLHTEFINSNLSARQRDEVRILKYLLKAHSIYGAEVKTNGFSGYLCELLVHHYGSLHNLLLSAAKFRLPLIIEPKQKRESHEDDVAKRFSSKFVVIDPVDPNRNVAAGVSAESLSRFVIIARQFVAKPSIGMFKGRMNELRHYSSFSNFLKSSGIDSFMLEAKVSDKSEDVVYPQLRKIGNMISERAERTGFNVYVTVQFISAGKGYIALLAQSTDLRTRLVKGPDAFIPEASKSFIDAHKKSDGIMVRGTTLFALDSNKYDNIEKILKEVALGRYVKSSDVRLKGAKTYMNAVPKAVEKELIKEIDKKLVL